MREHAYPPEHGLSILSGDRHLAGVYVQASRPQGPLFLLFHGDGEAVGDWSAAQTFLAHEGSSSLVFDYSGYGASTGRPSIDRLREDAHAAYDTAVGLARGRAAGVLIVAHSLGCNVALDAVPVFTPRPVGCVLWGVTPSLREYVAASGGLPRPLLFLIPDRWNNVRAAVGLRVPVLVLHGREDRVTAAGAAAVARAVPGGARFLGGLRGRPQRHPPLPERVRVGTDHLLCPPLVRCQAPGRPGKFLKEFLRSPLSWTHRLKAAA